MKFRAIYIAAALFLLATTTYADDQNLIPIQPVDSTGHLSDNSPFTLTGDIASRYLGNPQRDTAGYGLALQSARRNGDDPAGSVSTTVSISLKRSHWYRFQFRGLPQDGFAASDLHMQVEYLGGQDGTTHYDGKREELYPIIEQARKDLTTNGDLHVGGAAVWRNYQLDFFIPFPQINRLKLTIAFAGGHGTASQPQQSQSQSNQTQMMQRPMMRPMRGMRGPGGAAGPPPEHLDTAGDAFFITDWSLTPITNSAELLQSATATTQPTDLIITNLIPLGGRWYYQPTANQTAAPSLFDHTNADRLLYKNGPAGPHQFEAPFAGNTTAVLRKGDKDENGDVVTQDRVIEDNVTIRFDSTSLIIHTHAIPNHPTGKFPEGFIDGRPGNPSYITEQQHTYYLPLDPKVNPSHFATDIHNQNHALNMGPIGIATNGVVFFNPFDAQSTDASSAMDRCCGHPNQDGLYHYHKYPVCVNSPWADEGQSHSPLIGFAFDGFPIYGPYESKDTMAKDLTGDNALNSFNIHYDQQRGWHYHATPGKFPYIIGGYWGYVDRRDQGRPDHPGNRRNQMSNGMTNGPDNGPPDGGPPPDGEMGDFPPPPPPPPF